MPIETSLFPMHVRFVQRYGLHIKQLTSSTDATEKLTSLIQRSNLSLQQQRHRPIQTALGNVHLNGMGCVVGSNCIVYSEEMFIALGNLIIFCKVNFVFQLKQICSRTPESTYDMTIDCNNTNEHLQTTRKPTGHNLPKTQSPLSLTPQYPLPI